MKLHVNKVLVPVTALAVSWSFIACEKPVEKSSEPAKPAEPGKPADSAKPVEAAKAAVENAAAKVVAAVTPATDVSNIAATYGFAAQLPKDVETFSNSYRLHDMWVSVANSKWAATFVDLIKKQPDGQRMLDQWNSPQAEQGKGFAEAFLGNEFFFAGAAGFSGKVAPLVELMQEVQMLQLQALVTNGMMGGNPADGNKALMRMLKDNAAELIPKATKLELPPMIMGFKAGKVRKEIEGPVNQMLENGGLPPGVEVGKFKVSDKYDFQSLSVQVRKVIPPTQEAQMLIQFKELLGDEAQAKAAVDALMAKRVELSWGWVGEYLVMSIGSDHAHVKLAASAADSALSIPEVAARAALFADKKPIGLAYSSKALFDSMSKPVELAKPFGDMTASLQGILAPDAIKGMTADVKSMEGKVQSLMKTNNSAQVGVTYLDGGLRMDALGGPRSANAGPAKPLALSTLATPTTALSIFSHDTSTNNGQMAAIVEDGASMVFGWYEKFGRKMVPEDGQQGAATVEAIAKPMVIEFWKSCRMLGKAFGDQSAMLVDLNGPMPQLPQIPPSIAAGGKMPRLALAMDLKDRAALGEAWKGFEKLIKQGIAFIPQGADAPPIPEPLMRKEGDVEIHYVDLPMKLGDLLPHIAISKDKWILSTSPSYSAELAKQGATGTANQNVEMRADIGALANFADAWMKVAAANPSEFFKGNASGAEEFQKAKPMIDAAMGLVRSLKSATMQVGEEGGKNHMTGSFLVEDLK
jgi:hypothetical protein